MAAGTLMWVSGDPVTAGVKSVATPATTAGIKWLWRRWRPDLSPPALDAAQQALAERVAGVEALRLGELGVVRNHGIPIRVGQLGSLDDIVTIYDGIPDGRLVLTGVAGSGKTVAVLHLVLGLVEQRQQAGGGSRRVPVRVNAAGWDGDLAALDFLVQRIHEAYGTSQLRPAVIERLLTTKRLVTVLDGLDEMDPHGAEPARAAAALERLSETPARDWPLVVTCRSDTYDQLLRSRDGRGVLYAQRLTVQPLTLAAIEDHVQTLLDADDQVSTATAAALDPLLQRLDQRPSGPLVQALGTPWLLTLTLGYLERGGPAAAERLISQPSPRAVQDILFAAQIPQAVASQRREHGHRRYRESDVQRWLTTLARFLTPTDGGRSEIGLHELWVMAGPTKRTRFLHDAAVFLSLVLVAGLVGGLAGWTAGGLAGWTATAVLLGLVCGLLSGFGYRLIVGAGPWFGHTGEPFRIVLRTHRKGTAWPRVRLGLAGGLPIGLFGLAFGLVGLAFGLAGGLALGLGVGLALGLANGLWLGVLAVPPEAEPPQPARRVISDDLLASTAIGLTIGLTIGLVTGLVFGLTGGLTDGLTIGLAFGLATWLTTGLALGAACVRYTAAAWLFRQSGIFTARPVPLLNWASNAGLLRTTGIRYQFRHETYREWLATQARPAARTGILAGRHRRPSA